MTDERWRQTVESLKDKELRDNYVSDHITEGIAFQIRAMREARGWTQRELGERVGITGEERISLMENPNEGFHSLEMLRRAAAAFDVALIVRFAPYSDLVDWTLSLSPNDLAVPSFNDDLALQPKLTGGGGR